MELLILLPLTGWVLAASRWLYLTPARGILFAVSMVLLLLYAGGLLDLLPLARVLVVAVGVLLLGYAILRQRDHARVILASVPLIALLVLALLFYLLLSQSHFRFYDEYSHWGIHLREMLALGGFWGADSNSLHPRYPPGPTLWQYLFFLGGNFRDGTAYLAQFVLLVTPLLMLLDGVELRPLKRSLPWVLVIVALLLTALASLGHGIASLYVDHLLGAWVAGLIIGFVSDNAPLTPKRALAWLMPLAALALIKDTGFFFALALAGLFAVLTLLRHSDSGRMGDRLRLPALLLAAWLAAPALVALSWDANRDAANTPADTMSVAGLAGILTGATRVEDPERAALVKDRFLEVFVKHPLTRNASSYRFNESSFHTLGEHGGGPRLSTATFLLVYVLGALLAVAWLVPRARRLQWSVALAGLLGMALAYLAMLYLSYQYVFPRRDALAIASFVRYAHSVTLPMFLLLMASLLPLARDGGEQSPSNGLRPAVRGAIVLAVIAALMVVERPFLTPLYRPASEPGFRAEIRPYADSVRAIAGRARVWVYFPDPNEHLLLTSILLHELTPTPATIERQPEFFRQSLSAIETQLAEFEFAWFMVQDESVSAVLGQLARGEPPREFYAVEKTSDGGIRLVSPQSRDRAPPG